ncbi:hypothetical protein ACFX1R_027183 [Malus domestica]
MHPTPAPSSESLTKDERLERVNSLISEDYKSITSHDEVSRMMASSPEEIPPLLVLGLVDLMFSNMSIQKEFVMLLHLGRALAVVVFPPSSQPIFFSHSALLSFISLIIEGIHDFHASYPPGLAN